MKLSRKVKVLALGIASMLAAGAMAGCGSEQSAGNKTYKIGVAQLVEHSALDAANKGFVDGLKERGFEEGKNVTLSVKEKRLWILLSRKERLASLLGT